jgi:hypothetical protein
MPKRKSAAAEAAQPLPAEEAVPPVAASTAPAGPSPEERKRPPFPDVSEQKEVLISPGPDGAKLRLLRSSKYKQMQISSDGELPEKAQERLHAAGWRDRTEEEGIWTKQLPPLPEPGAEGPEPSPSRRRMVFDAERLFEEIANAIRADRKMPPVRLGGAAVAER